MRAKTVLVEDDPIFVGVVVCLYGVSGAVAVECSIVVPMCGHPSRISRLLRDLASRDFGSFRIVMMRSKSAVPYLRIARGCGTILSLGCCRGAGSNPKRAHGCKTRQDRNRCLVVLSSSYVLPRKCLSTVRARLGTTPTSTFKNPSHTRSSFASVRGTVGCSVASFFAAKNVHNKGGGVSGFCPHDFGVKIEQRMCRTLNNFSGVQFNRSVSFDVHVFGRKCHYELFPNT